MHIGKATQGEESTVLSLKYCYSTQYGQTQGENCVIMDFIVSPSILIH